MLYQIKSYFLFWMQSTTKYGVHSPFVFNLITQCFDQNTHKKKRAILSNYRQFLTEKKEMIQVTDFGAGSRIFKSNERRVSQIVRHVGISKKQANLLIRLVAYFDVNSILEIGTSLGMGTLALALGNHKAQIITLEGCPETIKIPMKYLSNYIDNTIDFKVGEFGESLPKVIANNAKYDLIYFDGNHQAEPTITYFEQCLTMVHNDTIFIFDDIHWSKEMTSAWEYIKDHEKVKLTIDTFYWGFVFFRKEQQEKEHFVIRI